MAEKPEEIFPPVPPTEWVFDLIFKEVDAKAKQWASNKEKKENAESLLFIASLLKRAIQAENNAPGAALCAFNIATLISQIDGSKGLRKIGQRFDAIGLEIIDIAKGLKQSGQRPTAALIWRELVKRCEQPGSCCMSIENDPKNDRQKIVWRRTGGGVGRMDLANLRQRIKGMVV